MQKKKVICYNLSLVKYTVTSLPERLQGFFSGGKDPPSNVSAGTGLPTMAGCAGASARYHAQGGRHPGEAISCALLAWVARVPFVSKRLRDDVMSKV